MLIFLYNPMVFGNNCNFWCHQSRLTCYLDSPQFSVLWAVFWCHVNVIYISWRFVSCHLILSNLITLCSYVMHFRSRGAIERQSNTQWPTWDDTQTLPSLIMPDVTMCAQQLFYTNTTGGCKVQNLRFYSQSQISWILEAARFDVKMVLSEVW